MKFVLMTDILKGFNGVLSYHLKLLLIIEICMGNSEPLIILVLYGHIHKYIIMTHY